MNAQSPSVLTEEARSKLIRKFWDRAQGLLQERGVLSSECPMCKRIEWTMIEDIIMLPDTKYSTLWAPEDHVGIGPHYPSVSLICTNCGNTQMFNIYVLFGNEINEFPPYARAPKDQ